MASHYADAVGFLDEADERGHALETWSDAAAQYWANVERQRRSLLTGGFATFHLRPVLGETRMPMDCVILAGGGNAELRSWKAFGQWVKIIRKASLRTPSPEHTQNRRLHTRHCNTKQESRGRSELRRAKLGSRGKFDTCFVPPKVRRRLWDRSVAVRKSTPIVRACAPKSSRMLQTSATQMAELCTERRCGSSSPMVYARRRTRRFAAGHQRQPGDFLGRSEVYGGTLRPRMET